jgi:hypothetical protein
MGQLKGKSPLLKAQFASSEVLLDHEIPIFLSQL